MSIGEILQEALFNANQERLKWHYAVQALDSDLVDLRAHLQRAETTKAGADNIHKAADEKYRALLEFCNNPATDPDTKRALGPQIETFVQNVNFTVRNVREAGDEMRRRRRDMEEIEKRRAVAQSNLTTAAERWEQIKKQLAELN
jgi:hypothetical protein